MQLEWTASVFRELQQPSLYKSTYIYIYIYILRLTDRLSVPRPSGRQYTWRRQQEAVVNTSTSTTTPTHPPIHSIHDINTWLRADCGLGGRCCRRQAPCQTTSYTPTTRTLPHSWGHTFYRSIYINIGITVHNTISIRFEKQLYNFYSNKFLQETNNSNLINKSQEKKKTTATQTEWVSLVSGRVRWTTPSRCLSIWIMTCPTCRTLRQSIGLCLRCQREWKRTRKR